MIVVVIMMKNGFKSHKKQKQLNNAVVSQHGERKNAERKRMVNKTYFEAYGV